MQVLITHGHAARTRLFHLSRWQLGAGVAVLLAVLVMLSGALYHLVFLKAAREGWPVVSPILQLVVRDEFAQRDRYMRENLDAMARKVGEMQAKLVKLEAVSERVSGMAGIDPAELQQVTGAPAARTATPGGAVPAPEGGPFVPAASPSLEQLEGWVGSLDEQADQHRDVYTLIESRLLERRLQALTIPNSRPVAGPVGSRFGFRSDPFTGRAALHTGLDFPAETGTLIRAAAGGVVLSDAFHPQYGNLVEIDHGRGLVTRYAHTSKVLVRTGDLVKRGQAVAHVGSTGRSTGPHLHFEVLLDGVPQNPSRFLAFTGDAAADVLRPRRPARRARTVASADR
jgi:murein DD-endopeptidase MepM/ murein hydrolase activator NlpD